MGHIPLPLLALLPRLFTAPMCQSLPNPWAYKTSVEHVKLKSKIPGGVARRRYILVRIRHLR